MEKKLFSTIIFVCFLIIVNTAYAQNQSQNPKQINTTSFFTTQTKGVVLTTDYLGDSSLGFFSINPLEVLAKNVGPTQGDEVIRYFDEKIYVLNRFGYDRIDVFSAEEPYEYLYNFSTGAGTNPQDIAFISKSKAYITCYDSNDLLIVNPLTGAHLGTIDLSMYADEDGFCEMHRMLSLRFLGKHRVYVTVQRLNRSAFYAPTDKSYLVELNADTDSVLHGIELEKTNPVSTPFIDGYYVIVSCAGSWLNDTDGGVERVHLFSNTAEGCILTEQEAGGNIIKYDIYPRYVGFRGFIRMFFEERFNFLTKARTEVFLVNDLLWNTKLFNRQTENSEITEIYGTIGYNIPDFTLSQSGFVFVCDRSVDAFGLRVFDVGTGDQITEQPLQTGGIPPAVVIVY